MGKVRDKVDAAELKKMEARQVIATALAEAAKLMNAYRIDVKMNTKEALLEIAYFQQDEEPSATDSVKEEKPNGEQDAD